MGSFSFLAFARIFFASSKVMPSGRNIMDLKNKIEKMFILNVDYKQLAKSSQIRYSSEKHYNELLELYQQ